MIVAIPLETNIKSSLISKKFARSNFFAIVDNINNTQRIVENPFKELNLGVGKNILHLLTEQFNVDTLLAFELGLKVQQMACKNNLQIIIISEKKQTLKQLLNYLKMN